MKLLRDSDPRFRWLGAKLLAFIVLAVLAVAGLVYAIAVKQGYFVAKTPLLLVSESGTDLKVGMAVKFSGFKIGQVEKLTLDEVGHVNIEIVVEDRYLKWIKRDSVGHMMKDGLIGDSYIGISGGTGFLPPVDRNSQLIFVAGKSFDEIAQEVRDRVVPVIEEVEKTLHYVNDPKGDVVQALQNFNRLSQDLQQTRSRIDSAIAHFDALAAKDVPETLLSARKALERADAAIAQVQEKLPPIMDKANNTLANVEAASAEAKQAAEALRKTAETAAPDAGRLLKRGNELLDTGADTLDSVRRSWPLNRMVAPEEPQAPRIESHE